jgi:hypothetical protein
MNNKELALRVLLYIEKELEKINKKHIENLNNLLKEAVYLSEKEQELVVNNKINYIINSIGF